MNVHRECGMCDHLRAVLVLPPAVPVTLPAADVLTRGKEAKGLR